MTTPQECLRRHARNGYHGIIPSQDMERAADALDEQADEIERLRGIEKAALKALRLHVKYEATPTDRGGKSGPKGKAWAAFIKARDAALLTARREG